MLCQLDCLVIRVDVGHDIRIVWICPSAISSKAGKCLSAYRKIHRSEENLAPPRPHGPGPTFPIHSGISPDEYGTLRWPLNLQTFSLDVYENLTTRSSVQRLGHCLASIMRCVSSRSLCRYLLLHLERKDLWSPKKTTWQRHIWFHQRSV